MLSMIDKPVNSPLQVTGSTPRKQTAGQKRKAAETSADRGRAKKKKA